MSDIQSSLLMVFEQHSGNTKRPTKIQEAFLFCRGTAMRQVEGHARNHNENRHPQRLDPIEEDEGLFEKKYSIE